MPKNREPLTSLIDDGLPEETASTEERAEYRISAVGTSATPPSMEANECLDPAHFARGLACHLIIRIQHSPKLQGEESSLIYNPNNEAQRVRRTQTLYLRLGTEPPPSQHSPKSRSRIDQAFI